MKTYTFSGPHLKAMLDAAYQIGVQAAQTDDDRRHHLGELIDRFASKVESHADSRDGWRPISIDPTIAEDLDLCDD